MSHLLHFFFYWLFREEKKIVSHTTTFIISSEAGPQRSKVLWHEIRGYAEDQTAINHNNKCNKTGLPKINALLNKRITVETSSGIGFKFSLMYPTEGGINALLFPEKGKYRTSGNGGQEIWLKCYQVQRLATIFASNQVVEIHVQLSMHVCTRRDYGFSVRFFLVIF